MKKTAMIIGAGFAGLSCAAKLSACGAPLEIVLFDRKPEFNFLPLLPDCIGRNIAPHLLTNGLLELSKRYKTRFVLEEVRSLDLAASRLATVCGTYTYDYLLVSSGSQTNFFSDKSVRELAYPLNNVEDLRRIKSRLEKDDFSTLVICGGGYTGIETATNLARYFKNGLKTKKIIILERSVVILGPLAPWMKAYAALNLKNMGIEVWTGSTIEKIFPDSVQVSGGRLLEKALVFWMPGTRTADFIQDLPVLKNPQGRIMVDEYLQFSPGCFAAGDAADFIFRRNPLRMAVQFSINQGAHVAGNIINSIRRKPLKKFRPLDLGYIVPMANNLSCGRTLGLNVRGRLATLLHFSMCIFRSKGWSNKLGLIGNLLNKGGDK